MCVSAFGGMPMMPPGGLSGVRRLQPPGVPAGSIAAPGVDVLARARAAAGAGRWLDVLGATEHVSPAVSDPAVLIDATLLRATALAQLGRAGEALSLLQSARQREAIGGRPAGAAALALGEAELRFALGQPQQVIALLTEGSSSKVQVIL